MKIETTIQWEDYNKLMKNVTHLAERTVEVGYFDEVHEESGLTMAQLASYQENGVRGLSGDYVIPPRPHVHRSSFILADTIDREVRLTAVNALKGNHTQVDVNLKKIGEKGIDALQQAIDSGGFQKLSPTTIRIKRAKNSRYPEETLLDSGALYQGSEYKIK